MQKLIKNTYKKFVGEHSPRLVGHTETPSSVCANLGGFNGTLRYLWLNSHDIHSDENELFFDDTNNILVMRRNDGAICHYFIGDETDSLRAIQKSGFIDIGKDADKWEFEW